MHIRLIEANEFSVIESLAREIWPVCYADILSTAQLEYMLDLMYSEQALKKQKENGQLFYLLEEGKEVVGFMGLQFSYPEPTDVRVHKLYVRMNVQGKGMGKFLLNKVEEMAQEKGLKRIHLNVNRFNKAKSFYEHLGFAVLKEEDIDIGSGYWMEDFVMVKNF